MIIRKMRRATKNYFPILLVMIIVNLLIYLYSINYWKRNCKLELIPESGENLNISKSELLYLNNHNLTDKKIYCVNKNKYIRYECKKPLCGGWADRLRGLMSAYVWALFTKREFLIDVDYPCSLSLMLEPNNIDWNKKIKCYDYDNELINSKEPFTSIRLDKVSNRNFYLLLRDLDIFEYYKEANLITIRNNLDWVYAFSFNKLLNNSIHEFGYKADNFKLYYFFRKFYNDLFKLSPSLLNRYNKFLLEAKPNNNTKLLCAQIRIGGVRPNVAFDMQFTSRNNTILFWNFIKENFLNKNLDIKYKLFITSDTESVELEAIKEFGLENIVRIDGPFVHIDRENVGNINDCSRVEKVILDFHALQNCDIAIISQSGYGRYGIANRPNPTQDLYRFETIKEKTKLKTGEIIVNNKYIFKKIESINAL